VFDKGTLVELRRIGQGRRADATIAAFCPAWGFGMSDKDHASPSARQPPRPGRPLPWCLSRGRARGALAALIGIALAGLAVQTSTVTERADELAFDAEVSIVRALRAPTAVQPTRPDVVVVGVDEASLDALGVPMAMMHSALGKALEAIAAAQPRAIGLDIALPERSFDHLLPGLDLGLMHGLRAARTAAGIVVALDTDATGHLRAPSQPLLAAAGGPGAFGFALFPVDCDGVVRRFDPDPAKISSGDRSRCGASDDIDPSATDGVAAALSEASDASTGTASIAVPTFVARLAGQLGREAQLSRPAWIDFTRGAPFSYVPLRDVVAWYQGHDQARLAAQFGGQIVLLGSVLPYLDRLRLPATLVAWELPAVPAPGVILNAQVLRNALGAGLVRPVALPVEFALIAAIASIAFVGGPWSRWWALAWTLALGLFAATALHAAGWFVAPGGALIAASTAVLVRTALDLANARHERERLTRMFGGYLSPQLLRAVLEDRVEPGCTRRAIALLFADLRGFTQWSETTEPEIVHDTLNRYYAAITPLLHAHGGTIDNFRGDGIMVMFGAPEAQPRPCDAAFAAAGQILAAVDRLNVHEIVPCAVPAVQVTMGLAFGDVVFGDVGSAERKDYTALGDAVNVAARLQELAKRLAFPVLMTESFARQLSTAAGDLHALGTHELKGHSPVAICGWTGPHPASTASQGEWPGRARTFAADG